MDMAKQRSNSDYRDSVAVVPCDCGSTRAYWHGTSGLRQYCCLSCWNQRSKTIK